MLEAEHQGNIQVLINDYFVKQLFFFLLPSRRMGSASKPHTFLAKTIKEIAEVSQVELNPWEVFPL